MLPNFVGYALFIDLSTIGLITYVNRARATITASPIFARSFKFMIIWFNFNYLGKYTGEIGVLPNIVWW